MIEIDYELSAQITNALRAWRRRRTGGFSPRSLFAASEPGVWLDPSDLSTLFQDDAGTTPVTAAGQSVGLMLDKHIDSVYQQTTGIVWTKTAGDGVLTVNGNEVTVTGATTPTQISRTAGSIPFQAGLARMHITATWVTATGVHVWLRGAPSTLTNGVTATRVMSLNNSELERLDVSTGTVTFTVTALEYWRGNHATQATAASRPTYQVDSGGRGYLSFDGVDDFLVTPTITPNIDKAQVFAGVRKLSDAATGMLVESVANNGTIYVAAPESTSIRYSSLSRGDAPASLPLRADITSGSAPDTAVITATHDIAGDLSTIRRNGVAGTNATGDKGAGNFLAYPLYIGRRGGTTLPFNGRLYGLITRFGANLTADQISQIERWMAQKTGVTL